MAKKENNEMSWAKSKMHDVLLWLIHIDRKANQKFRVVSVSSYILQIVGVSAANLFIE